MEALRDALNQVLISTIDTLHRTLFIWLPGLWTEGPQRWLLSLLLIAALLIAVLVRLGREAWRERALLRAISDGLSRSGDSTAVVQLFFETVFRVVRAPAACFYLAALPERPLLLKVKQANRAVRTQPDWEPEMRIEAHGETQVTRKGDLVVVSFPVTLDGHPLALVQVAATTAKDVARVRARVGLLRTLLTPLLARLVSLERMQRLEERAAEASVVSGSSQRLLNVSLAPEELASMLLDLIVRSTGSDAGLVVLEPTGREEHAPRVLAAAGLTPPVAQTLLAPLGESLWRGLDQPVSGIACPEPRPDVGDVLRRQGFGSFIQVPIADAGPPLGAIFLMKRDGAFRENHGRICRLNATRLALTLKNRAYHQAAFDQYKETLQTIVATHESAHPYSQDHSGRMARLACDLARRLDLTETQVDGIRLAAELHDLGMAGLADNVLLNPNQFTGPQYDLVKHHPIIGAALTAPIQFPIPIAPLILHHHERYDGSGYPSGLKGPEIPLGARILALGEVWDALVMARSYRPAFAFPDAMRRLRGMAGTQLDPGVVEAFDQTITAERWQDIVGVDKS